MKFERIAITALAALSIVSLASTWMVYEDERARVAKLSALLGDVNAELSDKIAAKAALKPTITVSQPSERQPPKPIVRVPVDDERLRNLELNQSINDAKVRCLETGHTC